ncbi:MAG: tetratricopeptide repeat protein [Nitrospirae bacterium]|nr:tetratricopeptide repeat protein [Nitrospirota bacterium]MBI4838531.1 tetratricopeptide repeat protein [Nitrospirota bacterium]
MIEAYKKALKLKPNLEYAHYNLGINYLAVDDRNSALEEFKALKDINAELANKLFNLIYK